MSMDALHRVKSEDWTMERALRRIADLEEGGRKACALLDWYREENRKVRVQLALVFRAMDEIRESLSRDLVGEEGDEFLR